MAELFKLTLLTIGGSGELSVDPGSETGEYEAGSFVGVSIVPDSGFVFLSWKIDGVTVSSTNTFLFQIPSSDIFLVANLSGQPVADYDYGLKYYFEFKPQQSELCSRLEIYAKGWISPAERREMGDVTYTFGNRGNNVLNNIIGSSIDFELAVLETDDYLEFLEADPRFFQVKYYQFYGTPSEWVFVGYLKTDFINRPYLSKNYLLSCHASDILNTLDAFIFEYQLYESTTAIEYISHILAQTVKDPLPISTCVNILETRMDVNQGLFEQFGINSGRYYDEGRAYYSDDDGIVLNDSFDLKTILTYLLKSFVCRIFQWNGRYYIVRINEWVKPELIFRNYTGLGVYIDSSTIPNTQIFDCLDVNNASINGELSYNEFHASLKLGYLNVPELNTIIYDEFQNAVNVGGGDVLLKLSNWKYMNTVPFDGDKVNEISRLELISGGANTGTGPDWSARFWSTANGISDPNISYIEINSTTQGTSTNVSVENANLITIEFGFSNDRVGDWADVPPEGSNYVAIQVQIGSSYLYKVSENVYDWTTTPTLCLFPIINRRTGNSLKITGVSVPEDGELKLRVYQVITLTGDRNRYLVVWHYAKVTLEKNDSLANTDVFKIGKIDTKFTNVFENYETFIGDSRTNLSVSAIKLLNISGDPVSVSWSRDGVEELELLDIIIDEIADLYGKNNYRFYLDYYSEVDVTKKITIGSADYFVNSCMFNGSESKWELDLFRLT